MFSTKSMLGLVACTAMGLASAANAQTVVTMWNFNAAGLTATGPAPSTGTGTASLIGGIAPTAGTVLGFASDSGSSDPTPTNATGAWTSSTYPAQGTNSGTAGMVFTADCTGRANLSFEFDMQTSTSASRYWSVEYSTTGAGGPWTAFPAMPYATVGTVAGGGSFGSNINIGSTFTLPAAADNNANVACRIVSVFDPAGLPAPFEYARWNILPNVYGPGGTMRVDMVEFRDNTPVSQPPTIAATPAAPLTTCQGTAVNVNFIVTTTPGLNPTSTTLAVTGDFTSLLGSATEPMIDLGGGSFGITFPVSAAVTAGIKTVTFTVTDDLVRSAQVSTTFGVGNCSNNASSGVVISQVYGGSGSATTSAFNQDFIVLHNRGCSAVDITNWSIQYGTAAAVPFSQKIDLIPVLPATSISIPVGGYYLIQTNVATAANINPAGLNLDATTRVPDFTSNAINMSGTNGRVAVVGSAVLVTNPVTDASVKDFVGFGTFALNFEGAGAAPTSTNADALFRKLSGNQDSNENFNDFQLFAPAPLNSTDPAASGPCCPADLDNGTGLGTRDGGVDINDLLYFLTKFEAGATAADLDNGSGLGIPDGGVDINDLLFFLIHFEAGC